MTWNTSILYWSFTLQMVVFTANPCANRITHVALGSIHQGGGATKEPLDLQESSSAVARSKHAGALDQHGLPGITLGMVSTLSRDVPLVDFPQVSSDVPGMLPGSSLAWAAITFYAG
jgi:hypothetical protein